MNENDSAPAAAYKNLLLQKEAKRTLKAIWWGMVLGLTLLCFVVMKIFEDAFFF